MFPAVVDEGDGLVLARLLVDADAKLDRPDPGGAVVELERHRLPVDIVFWDAYNRAMLIESERLLVLRLDGWELSQGVWLEIYTAGINAIPVDYADP